MKSTFIKHHFLLLPLLVLVLFYAGCQQKCVRISSSCEISDGDSEVLTVENFLRIREFVFVNGNMVLHSSLFGDAPVYHFQEFNVYLYPDNPVGHCSISNYYMITISTTAEYYVSIQNTQRDALYLRVRDVEISDDILKSQAEGYFQEMLTEIEQTEQERQDDS